MLNFSFHRYLIPVDKRKSENLEKSAVPDSNTSRPNKKQKTGKI